MASVRSGDIVLFRFPQTDLGEGKLRPALVIAPVPSEYEDFLVCMVTTKAFRASPSVEELISASDPDFSNSGLRHDSVFRLTRLAIVSESILEGRIGRISDDKLDHIRQKLVDWIATAP